MIEFVNKITGIKEKDDCEYYYNRACLENITIKEIEIVADKQNISSLESEAQQQADIDIENTIVECKNGEKYLGKDLTGKGLNFSLIESKIFYKGEELEGLCNPSLKEYSYEAEPSFNIIPAYLIF